MTTMGSSASALSRARLLTAVWVLCSLLSVVFLPVVGVLREESAGVRTTGIVGVGLFLLAQVLVMWSAVTPWASVGVHRRSQLIFVAAAVLSVPLVAPAGADQWATWAWLGASVIGTAPLVWRWPVTWAVTVLAALVSLAVALVFDGDRVSYLVITVGFGLGLALINWTPIWLWELLLRADATQQAGALAAAAHERNRFGREVHDVLGHDLTVIALKSELAARTAATDPVTAAREAEEVRALAEAALGRVREQLVTRREVDIDDEIAAMVDVLSAAGVRTDTLVRSVALAPPVAAALAMVLKEATTNLLRHSDARRCRIRLDPDQGRATLTIENDGAREPFSGSGSGLTGLRERLGVIGGRLTYDHAQEIFTVTAEVPTVETAPGGAP